MYKLNMQKAKLFFIFLSTILICSACASDPYQIKRTSKGKYIGHYKIGKPYIINGKQYKREVNEDYEEVGIASYYGENDGFHGKKTANGDIFNKNALTAAHKTLPLPSMVRVTNLENNKSLILMVNDGGPYVDGRIIDVSVRAAELLGFKKQGLAKVKVKYLPLHTRRLYADLKLKVPETYKPKPVMLASNNEFPNLNNEIEKRLTQKIHEGINKKYFVQIGAYQSHNNAVSVMRNVRNLGNSSLVITKINGKDLHKIHLGPYENQEEAENILTKVAKLGNVGARIINK